MSMTVREALVEKITPIIDVQDAASIAPSLPVAYLAVLSTMTRKYGYESSALLSAGAKTEEELRTLVADIKAALGSSVTASDGRHLARVTWDAQEAVKMLDGSWGQRISLKIIHWEA